MTDTDYIQLRSGTGIIVGLETASLVIETLNDVTRYDHIAFANGYDPEQWRPLTVEHESHPQTAGVEKQYAWRFEQVVTDSVELEDFMRYRNIDRGV